jgi:hypothetical protein
MNGNGGRSSDEGLVRPRAEHMPSPKRRRRSSIIATGAAVTAIVAILAIFAVLRYQSETAADTSTSSTTGSATSLPPTTLPLERWQQANGSPSDDHLQAVTATESRLIAVGYTSGDDIDPSVWLSADGVNWTRVARNQIIPGGLGSQRMDSVTGWPGGLVAVGINDDNAAVWTSASGAEWSPVGRDEEVFGGAGDQIMNCVVYGDVGFVAVGSDSNGGDLDAAVWASVDGNAWNRVGHDEDVFGGDGDQVMNAVAFGNGLYVAVGHSSTDNESVAAVWISSDGFTWSRIVGTGTVFGDEADPFEMLDVTAAVPGFVAVGRALPPQGPAVALDPVVWTSADGLPLQATVAFPGQGPAVWTSPDGLEWSRLSDDTLDYSHASMYGMYGMYGVATSEQGLVAVGYGLCDYCAALHEDSLVWVTTDGVSIVWETAEGVSWASTLGDTYAAMVAVTAGGPGFVAVGHWYNQTFSDGPPIWYGPPAASPTAP